MFKVSWQSKEYRHAFLGIKSSHVLHSNEVVCFRAGMIWFGSTWAVEKLELNPKQIRTKSKGNSLPNILFQVQNQLATL